MSKKEKFTVNFDITEYIPVRKPAVLFKECVEIEGNSSDPSTYIVETLENLKKNYPNATAENYLFTKEEIESFDFRFLEFAQKKGAKTR